MQKFELTLKNDKLKQYHRFALFLIVINFALLSILFINAAEKAIRINAAIGASLIAVALLIDYFLVRIKNNTDTPYRFAALYIAAVTWMLAGNWWGAALCFVIAFLYQVSSRKLSVTVGTGSIVLTSFPQKNISWDQLNNIMLKDGLLTVDFKNNKLLQAEVNEEQKPVNEKEFNEFCMQQLSRNRPGGSDSSYNGFDEMINVIQ